MSNMSASSFNTFAPLFETMCHTDIEVGSLKDMKRQYTKTVSAYEESQLKDLLQTRLGPVSTTRDSTPGAAVCEQNFQVVQVLVIYVILIRNLLGVMLRITGFVS